MVATKRKVSEIEPESEVNVKKKRPTLAIERTDDRLTDLPESLQLRILSRLNAQQAVQTTLLSKYWVNLWTRIPVLDFNYLNFTNTCVFEPFVDRFLHRDRLVNLDMLKFHGHSICSRKTLKNVFDYAFLHSVKKLEARVYEHDYTWPVSESDSLTSLKLQAAGYDCISCPFLGLGSTSFKNLAVLYLKGALITDVEPFSGFPMLESLTLLHCCFKTEKNKTVRVKSLRLSDLTISPCAGLNCWELKTPRLRFFEYGGSHLPKHEGLPVLETLKIDFRLFILPNDKIKEEKKRFSDDLMSLFSTVPNVKSVTMFTATVLLLTLFPDKLVRRGSPFRELKDLTLYISEDIVPSFCNKGKYEYVKAYFLQNSRNTNFTITRPTDIDEYDPWGWL